LDGSKSHDVDGDRLTYSWSQTKGPTVILNGPNRSKATFTAPVVSKDTALKFELAVTDNTGLKGFSPAAIIVRAGSLHQVQPSPSSSPIPKPTVAPPDTSQPSTSAAVVPGFTANGTIDSILFVPHNEWIATGNWSTIVDNGKVVSFVVNMVWNNANGSSSHTHQIKHFRPIGTATTSSTTSNNNTTKSIVTLQPDNSLVLKGLSDVGTNGRIVWKNVHTVVDINKGKTINIAVNDKETNSHFAGQHVFGIVKSLDRCSEQQQAQSMNILSSCSPP
jgi:hypothetical protein